jgi:molybdenum cofactor biosynthesis protein MoaC
VKDVTPKQETRRRAVAEARLRMPAEGRRVLEKGTAEKGDALEVSRVAGIMGGKKTPDLLPFCHPLPVTHADVEFELVEEGVRIEATASCIGPTGVEMEALTAASVAALSLYDMLKPHVGELEITGVRLLEKTGGKSDYRVAPEPPVRAGVLVLSDGVHAGEREDTAGGAVVEALRGTGGVTPERHEVLPDEPDRLRSTVEAWVDDGVDLILTVGGTGLSERDRTVDTLRPMLDPEVPGLMEAARRYGQRRTPFAMLSRGVAGMIGDTLVVTLPGSPSGATETYDAVFPAALHVFEVRRHGSGAHE